MGHERVIHTTKDPAPAASGGDEELAALLVSQEAELFDRFQAIFALRNSGSADAIEALGRRLLDDPSPLLRHEVAYVFGQMGGVAPVPYLKEAIRRDTHPMVRHEAVEALGNIPQADPDDFLAVVREDDEDPEVRASAALALANLAYLRDPARI